MADTDFVVNDHGTIWTFAPLTDAALEHALAHFPDDTPTLGHAYAVEHRYATDIVEALLGEGFLVTVDGEPVELRP